MPKSPSEPLDLEGMVSTLTVVKVMDADLPRLREALRAKVAQMPGLFDEAPIVLDLSGVDGHPDDAGGEGMPALAPVTLEALVTILRDEGLAPVATRNLRAERQAEAGRLGLIGVRGTRRRRPQADRAGGDLPRGDRDAPSREVGSAGGGAAPSQSQERAKVPVAPPPLVSPSLTIHQPVRGGQVIYAKAGDAVALAPVNPGGELIADGNIHIYAPLRGRALAGAHGDTGARIFCSSLQAELVSIAGTYLEAEELPEAHRGRPVQIRLEGERLVISDL